MELPCWPAGGPNPPEPGSTTQLMEPGTYVMVCFVPSHPLAVDLVAADYALLCFVPDAKDGKPHFAHGMAKLIKVT